MALDLVPGTDVTNILRSALAAGDDLDLPRGTYVTDTLTIATAGQLVRGDGTTLRQKTPGNHLFVVRADGVRIQALRLEGVEAASASSFAVFTAQANPARGLQVHGLEITGASAEQGFGNGVKADNDCHDLVMQDCFVDSLWGGVAGNGYGVLAAGNNARIVANRFLMAVERGRHGIYLSVGCSDSVVRRNAIVGSTFQGISQYAKPTQPSCARNVIEDNQVLACVTARNPWSGGIGIYGNCVDTRIVRNLVWQSGQKGIAIDGTESGGLCRRTLVEENTVNASGLIGIDLIAAKDTTLRDNRINDSSRLEAGVHSNIRLASDYKMGCVSTLIAGNQASGARSALQLNPTPPVPVDTVLIGNTFAAGAASSIELNGVHCRIDGVLN